ncbi:MAG: SiaB family protein kinase [Bacteroidia bacterium]|nr:SiaB family protein kinase [Bacteroidia bacterium]MDW8334651.1 SiaB family protein kinase [Bacteroidia bacterium]
MKLAEKISTGQVGSPLHNTYPIYKDMYDNNVIFSYRGLVTSDLVTSVLGIMEERLEEDRQNRRMSKKVFNVMVECLTNVYLDEMKSNTGYDPSALLLIKRVAGLYIVTTGSYIPTASIGELKKFIDRVNGMDAVELKALYQELLSEESPMASGLTRLGIIDLARKSKNRLIYQFKYENEHYSFFTLESHINYTSV